MAQPGIGEIDRRIRMAFLAGDQHILLDFQAIFRIIYIY